MGKLLRLIVTVACLTFAGFPSSGQSRAVSDPYNVTLVDWAEARISALFQATNVPDFDDAVSAYLAKEVNLILVNGEEFTREAYVARLHTSRETFNGATLDFIGSVSVQDRNGSEKAGEVGVFFKAHITENIESNGKPLTETAVCSFNMKIVQDPSVHPAGGEQKHVERRRVATLTTVYTREEDD